MSWALTSKRACKISARWVSFGWCAAFPPHHFTTSGNPIHAAIHTHWGIPDSSQNTYLSNASKDLVYSHHTQIQTLKCTVQNNYHISQKIHCSSLAYYTRKTRCYSGFEISPEPPTTIYLCSPFSRFPVVEAPLWVVPSPNTWYVAREPSINTFLDIGMAYKGICEHWHFDKKSDCLLKSLQCKLSVVEVFLEIKINAVVFISHICGHIQFPVCCWKKKGCIWLYCTFEIIWIFPQYSIDKH